MIVKGLKTFLSISFLICCVLGSPKRVFDESGLKSSTPVFNETHGLDEADLKEMEQLITNLDEQQLKELDAILTLRLEEWSLPDNITDELVEMGLDQEDILDLQYLSQLMYDFLSQIGDLKEKLKLSDDSDLSDNIRLYLLGLPNRLGPLGYVALHQVLEDESDLDHPLRNA